MNALAQRPGRSRFAACVRRFATRGCAREGLSGWARGEVLPVRWPTVAGKTYVLEVSSALGSTNWTALATNILGSGSDVEFQTPPPASPQFYRVRLVEP